MPIPANGNPITTDGRQQLEKYDYAPQSFVAYGTFDGATVTLEFSPDGGTTFIPIGDASSGATLTADGGTNFIVGYPLYVNVSGGGGSLSVTVKTTPIRNED